MKYLWIVFIIFIEKICARNDDCYQNCINNFNQSHFYENVCQEICMDNANENDKVLNTTNTFSIYDNNETVNILNPSLYCLTNDAFTITWKPSTSEESVIYLVELKNQTDWISTKQTKSNNISFIDLESDCNYQVKIWVIFPQDSLKEEKIFGPVISQWVHTFQSYFTPYPVLDISLKGVGLFDGKFQALVEWTPDEEYPSCYYDVVLFHGQRVGEFEFRELNQPFEAKFNNLEFEEDVTIIIHAKNEDEESTKTEQYFSTPACLEVVGNLSFCPPELPKGLTAEETIVQIASLQHVTCYDVTVHWDFPNFIPDYYRVVLTSTNLKQHINVSGNSTSHIFKNVEIGINYMITLKAFSEGGESKPAFIHRQSTHSAIPNSNRFIWVITTIGIIAVSFLILFCFGLYILHRRAKRKRYERRCKYFEELDGKFPVKDCITSGTGLILDENQEPDKWDIPVERLILQNVLGEGAFGLVRRAWLRDEQGNASTEVAVKMLKDAPSSDQIRQFMHEIEIMKTVGAHPNLVSLIGCTRLQMNPSGLLMLVVEFCALGDLQNYLRGAWEMMTLPQEQQVLKYADIMSTNSEGSTNLIINNKLYDIEANLAELNLKANDLLNFARQIAVGMEFLTSMKVLHRDLAARNVLVCSDKTVKIADFGLSRDVYKENMYRKSGNGKLPIRWMAIESLTHQIYTSQSDVWSFGILLWEIVTLGGNPYPSIPTNALLKYLKSGYRMERPTNCGFELYTIMLSCWKPRPKDRPTFTELRKSLDELLESVTTSKYLDLNVITSNEFSSFRVPLKDTSSGKVKHKASEVFQPDRYVHPLLLNNAKNSSGNTELPTIIK